MSEPALPRLKDVPRWNGRSVEEHAEAIVAVCEAAAAILEEQPDAEARLAGSDPVPDSTRAILRRLARANG